MKELNNLKRGLKSTGTAQSVMAEINKVKNKEPLAEDHKKTRQKIFDFELNKKALASFLRKNPDFKSRKINFKSEFKIFLNVLFHIYTGQDMKSDLNKYPLDQKILSFFFNEFLNNASGEIIKELIENPRFPASLKKTALPFLPEASFSWYKDPEKAADVLSNFKDKPNKIWPIVQAVWQNEPGSLEQLLSENKIVPNIYVGEGKITTTLLSYSIENGFDKIFDMLLDAKADPKLRDSDNFNSYTICVLNKRYDLLKKLFDKNTNKGYKKEYEQAFVIALSFEKIDYKAIELLLQAGVSPNIQVRIGEQKTLPLIYAIKNNDKKLLSLLLKAKADPTKKDVLTGKNAFSFLADVDISIQELSQFLDAYLKSNPKNFEFLLSEFISKNKIDKAVYLIEKGVNPNNIRVRLDKFNNISLPLLNYAILDNKQDLLNALLKVKANPLLKDSKNRDAFFITVSETNDINLLTKLLETYKNLPKQSLKHAFSKAIKQMEKEQIVLFLKYGLDPNDIIIGDFEHNEPALCYVLRNGVPAISNELAFLLLEAGADPTKQSSDFENAFEIAALNGKYEFLQAAIKKYKESGKESSDKKEYEKATIEALLHEKIKPVLIFLDAGVNKNLIMTNISTKESLLSFAITKAYNQLIDKLIEKKANPLIEDINGINSFSSALFKKDYKTLEKLIKAYIKEHSSTISKTFAEALIRRDKQAYNIFLKYDVDPNILIDFDNKQFTLFSLSIYLDQFDVSKALLKKESFKFLNLDKSDPFLICLEKKNISLFTNLISKAKQDKEFNTSALIPVLKASLEQNRFLFAEKITHIPGQNLNLKINNQDLLAYLLQKNKINLAQKFLEAGANPNSYIYRNGVRTSILYFSIFEKHKTLAFLLLDKGAEHNDSTYLLLERLLKEKQYGFVSKLISKMKLDVNKPLSDGDLFLNEAVRLRDKNAILMLKSHYADPNKKDARDKNAYDYLPKFFGRSKYKKLLLELEKHLKSKNQSQAKSKKARYKIKDKSKHKKPEQIRSKPEIQSEQTKQDEPGIKPKTQPKPKQLELKPQPKQLEQLTPTPKQIEQLTAEPKPEPTKQQEPKIQPKTKPSKPTKLKSKKNKSNLIKDQSKVKRSRTRRAFRTKKKSNK